VTSSGSDPPTLLSARFLVLFGATLAFFVAGGLVVPVSPRYAQDQLGGTPADVGLAIAIYSIAALVMRPVVGWASDRFGRRPVLVAGAIIAIAAYGAHLAATTLLIFIVVRAVLGIGEAFFFVAATAMAADLAPAERRGEAISYFSLAIYGGLAIGPWAGDALLGIGSYPSVWIAAAVITLVAVGLALRSRETVHAPDERPSGKGRRGFQLLHAAGVLPGILIFLGVFGMAGFLAFVPVYVDKVGLLSSVPLGIYASVVVVLRLVGARLPDRLGAVRLSGAALLATAAGLTLMGVVPSAIGLIVGTIGMSIGVAFTFPALIVVAVARVPVDERGTVVGTTTVFLDLAFGIAPLVLGVIAGTTGYGFTFVLSGVLAAIGWVVLRRTRERLEPAGSGRTSGALVG